MKYISSSGPERIAGLRSLIDFVIKGITILNAMSRMSLAKDATIAARTAMQAAIGLGPNQLSWLRSNIDAFRQAEDQRLQLRHDAMRAARIAGLV